MTRAMYRDIHGIQISGTIPRVKHLTYGEVRVDSFDQALSHASRYLRRDDRASVFDVGSGTGKAVLSAAYNSHIAFSKAWG